MPSTLPPLEGPTAHTSTQQWQSFEMRMRQRRIERLRLKADAALDAGAFQDARDALDEIESLDPHAGGVAERRARLEHAIADPPVLHPPDTIAAPTLLDLELRPPAEESASENRHRLFSLGRVAAAALAAGVIAWVAVQPSASRGLNGLMARFSRAEPIAISPKPDASPEAPSPLPPVQVAVDEVAPANTVAESAATESAAIQPTATEPAPTEPAPTDPAAADAVNAQPPRSEPAPPPLATAGAEAPLPVRTDEPAPPRSNPQPVAPQSVARPSSADRTLPPPVVQESRANAAPPAVPIVSTSALDDRTAATALPTTPLPREPIVAPTANTAASDAKAAPARTSASDASATAGPGDTADANRAPSGVAAEEVQIRSVLSRYESAYSRLDVDATGAIFPGIDRRALARAFDGLTSQEVNLGSCDVRVVGEIATAECSGSATWTPKVGGGTRNQPRRWQFRLRNISGWKIVSANVR